MRSIGLALLLVVTAFGVGAGSEPTSATEQKTCPPCRQEIKPFGKSLHVTHDERRIYVCCAGCAVKMQRDWDGYLGVMVKLGETPETVPASGEAAKEPVIANPEGRGVCEACIGGACALPEHKP